MKRKPFFDDEIYGQLKDLEEIKLLLLYIFISVKRPMTISEITDTIRRDELCNYFDMAECLTKLVERKLMHSFFINNEFYYSPTKKGFDALNILESKIPKATRDKAEKAAIITLSEILRKEQIKTNIKDIPLGEVVNLEINDDTINIFNLSIYLPNARQAEIVVKNFNADPEGFHMKVMSWLTENKKENQQ